MSAKGRDPGRLELGAFLDYRFRPGSGGTLTVERAFALFLFDLAEHVSSLAVLGRVETDGPPFAYDVPAGVEVVGLPAYPSLAHPLAVMRALRGVATTAWRASARVDALWVLGPHPVGLVVAVAARLRRRRVVLGVRQDLPRYTRTRHPGRRSLAAAADVLEGLWRLLARRCPVVAVGDDLAEHYRRAPAVHTLHVSLIRAADVRRAGPQPGGGSGRILTVSRLDAEKNPLLLADVLERLARDEAPAWRLEVYGDGPLRDDLEGCLAERGLAARSALHGYVPADGGLSAAYAGADVFLHVSWTEGVPQVLLEAFAAAVPVVATAVGGVAGFVGEAALLVPPGDPEAAADAVRRVANDPALRARLVAAGTRIAEQHTMEAEVTKLAEFLAEAA